jgi:hypothetical protein
MDDKEVIKKIWASFKPKLQPYQRELIKSRVLSGWSLKRAIKSFGHIFPATKADLSLSSEMFKSGEIEEFEAFETMKVLEENIKNQPDTFIRRPKPQGVVQVREFKTLEQDKGIVVESNKNTA